MKHFLLFLLAFAPLLRSAAQSSVSSQNKPKVPLPGKVSGRVISWSGSDKHILPFATITLLSAKDSSIVSGSLADKKGEFEVVGLPVPGAYILKVNIIGYKGSALKNCSLTAAMPEFKAGEVILQQDVKELNTVTVTGQASDILYKADRRIYNVKQNLNSLGGTAVDALQNIPSLTVQSDGSIQLRGSEKVLVLVDGKPSALTGNDRQAVLNQIPASLIESVEVITSPSAKYDAEASAGIINLITKRDKPAGMNALASFTAGTRDKYSGSLNVNWRGKSVNLIGSYDYIRDDRFVIRNPDREIFGVGAHTFLSERENGGAYINSHNLRVGADFFLSKKATLSVTALLKRGTGEGQSENKSTLSDGAGTPLNFYTLNPWRSETENTLDLSLGYRKLFNKAGREWTIDLVYLNGSANGTTNVARQNYSQGFVSPVGDPRLWQNISLGDFYTVTAQTDYVHPMGKKGKVMTGLKYSRRNNDADFTYNDYLNLSQQYRFNPDRSNQFIFDEQVFAGYLNYNSNVGKLDYSAGLRVEETLQDGRQTSPKYPAFNEYNYLNFFPSAILNYQLNDKQRINLGYTKRINRTAYGAINPFISYLNPYNLLAGNPNIRPELVNSFELGHLLFNKTGSFSTTVFYRYTKDQLARIRTVVDSLRDQNVTIMTIANVDNRSSYGIEFVANQNLSKSFKLMANISAFRTTITGNSEGVLIDAKSPTFLSKLTGVYKFKNDLEFQFTGLYRSSMPTTQGKASSIYYLDLGAKKEIFNKRATLSLRLSDVFNTLEPKVEIRGVDFVMYNPLKQESRVLFLGISYRLSKTYKPAERRERKVVNEGKAGEGEQ